MQVPGRTRPLTDKEMKCLRMLETWEALVDERRIYGAFHMTDDALDACHRLDVAQPLSVTRDRETGSSEVRFDLIELHKYIEYVCDHCNVTENVDGTMTTHDGLTVPIKCKSVPLRITKASNRK